MAAVAFVLLAATALQIQGTFSLSFGPDDTLGGSDLEWPHDLWKFYPYRFLKLNKHPLLRPGHPEDYHTLMEVLGRRYHDREKVEKILRGLYESESNPVTKGDVKLLSDTGNSGSIKDLGVKKESNKVAEETVKSKIIGSAGLEKIENPVETNKTSVEDGTDNSTLIDEIISSSDISTSGVPGNSSTDSSISTSETLSNSETPQSSQMNNYTSAETPPSDGISTTEVPESSLMNNSTSTEEALPSGGISNPEVPENSSISNSTSATETIPSDGISNQEVSESSPMNNSTSTAETLSSDGTSNQEVPESSPMTNSTEETLSSGGISSPEVPESSPMNNYTSETLPSTIITTSKVPESSSVGTTKVPPSDKTSADNSENKISRISTTSHVPASSKVMTTVPPRNLTEIAPHEHVISMPRIRTARIVISSVCLAIGLIVLAVMAVWIFGKKRRGPKYDQLKLLP